MCRVLILLAGEPGIFAGSMSDTPDANCKIRSFPRWQPVAYVPPRDGSLIGNYSEPFQASRLLRVGCGWMPRITFLHSWTGKRNITKDSWVKIRTGRNHSLITVKGKTDSKWGN